MSGPGSDKDRATELQGKVTAYQSKVPSDLQEKKNIDDIVATANNEITAVSGGRRFDGAGGGGLQQPRKAG
jgi:hypothetical protein